MFGRVSLGRRRFVIITVFGDVIVGDVYVESLVLSAFVRW